MADPNFDEITAATLESLRKEVVFDHFFKDDSFLARMKQKNFLLNIEEGWQRTFAKRALAMGVSESRVLETLAEMRKTRGGIEPRTTELDLASIDGGRILNESFSYAPDSMVDDQGSWDGNNYPKKK